MKKLATVVFAMLLTGSLAFAQAAATASPTPTKETGKKSHKSSKTHHSSKKSKKGAEPTPSPASK